MDQRTLELSIDSNETNWLGSSQEKPMKSHGKQREERKSLRIRNSDNSKNFKFIFSSKLGNSLNSEYRTILPHEEALKNQTEVKKRTIDQFLNILKRYQEWKIREPIIDKWGEQIQGMFYEKNNGDKLQLFSKSLWHLPQEYEDFPVYIYPETLIFQWQTIPNEPHERDIILDTIVTHIRDIYSSFHSKSLLCLPGNVLMYKKQSLDKLKQDNWFSKSQTISDSYYYNQGNSKNLSGKFYSFYRFRSNNNFQVKTPLFKDIKTNLKTSSGSEEKFIEMDSPIFAMYHSDLQSTFSSYNLDFVCYLHDQFHILAPLMFAWSASSVVHDYQIGDEDSHFMMIAEMFKNERVPSQKDTESKEYIPYGRYYPSSLYLWQGAFNQAEYCDLPVNIEPQIEEYIRRSAKQNHIEISEQLIKHLGYMMRIDTGMVRSNFSKFTNSDIQQFELFNKEIMPFIRLRNPIGGKGGWRIELRCKSTQLTSDYTAAMLLMDYLLAKLFQNRRDINLYIPISLLHINYQRGVKRDALKTERFYFRTNIFDEGHPIIQQLTVSEILFGKDNFLGLFKLIKEQLIIWDEQDNYKMFITLQEFFKQLVSGKKLTVAQWMRKFIRNHPLYKNDSIVSQQLVEQLILEMNKISSGLKFDEDLDLKLI